MNTAPLLAKMLEGQQKKSVDFSQFAQHLEGEALPDVTPDDIGKYRLRLFLRSKYGAGYVNHPVAQGMLGHFETMRKVLGRVR